MNSFTHKKYDLEERTALFAQRVRLFVKTVPRTQGNIEDIPQLIRSSGSIAANYIEANEALGPRDFLMRIRICLKESKESMLWLQLCETHNESVEQERVFLFAECQQFVRIFSSILKTSQRKSEH